MTPGMDTENSRVKGLLNCEKAYSSHLAVVVCILASIRHERWVTRIIRMWLNVEAEAEARVPRF